MTFSVSFGSVIAHTGPSAQEARSWYDMLIPAAHTYGRALTLRDDTEVIAYITSPSDRTPPARFAPVAVGAVA